MSLTSANSVLQLVVPNLFPIPQQLQGFAADDIFDVDQVKRAETLMGVDGVLSGGFVWEEVKQTITVQADSPSCILFDEWQQAQIAIADVYPAFLTVILPGILTKFACGPGFLLTASPMPKVKTLIQPRQFVIAWNNVSPAPV